MVDAGMMVQRACDKIYETYGQSLSVTQLIECLKQDERTRGGHPNLRDLNL